MIQSFSAYLASFSTVFIYSWRNLLWKNIFEENLERFLRQSSDKALSTPSHRSQKGWEEDVSFFCDVYVRSASPQPATARLTLAIYALKRKVRTMKNMICFPTWIKIAFPLLRLDSSLAQHEERWLLRSLPLNANFPRLFYAKKLTCFWRNSSAVKMLLIAAASVGIG